MKAQGCLAEILYSVRNVVLIDLVLLVIVGLICWLTGRRTFDQYGESLTLAGMLAIAVGLLSVGGNYSSIRNAGMIGRVELNSELNSVDVSARTSSERARDSLIEVRKSFGCLQYMIGSGVISIAIGALIQSVARS